MMKPGKERSILLTGDDVRGILAGRKTVLRRLVKDQPRDSTYSQPRDRGSWWGIDHQAIQGATHSIGRCPFGAPGDRLWVRETWAEMSPGRKTTRIAYRADMIAQNPTTRSARDLVPWALDDSGRTGYSVDRWRPSIQMPRRAARLVLDVVSVRVERLHDITEEDAIAEGVKATDAAIVFDDRGHRCKDLDLTHRGAFAILWDSTAPAGAKWIDNPWIWRVDVARRAP